VGSVGGVGSVGSVGGLKTPRLLTYLRKLWVVLLFSQGQESTIW
jgi:hypothetical protein